MILPTEGLFLRHSPLYLGVKKRDDGCSKDTFSDVLLVLVFNFPFYQNIPILHNMYDKVYKKVVTCGPTPDNTANGKSDIELNIRNGFYGYHCAAKAIEQNPGFNGE